MKKLGKVITTFGAALLMSAILFMPATVAHAEPRLTTTIVKGPVTTFASGTTVSSTATCPAGAQVVTGGSFDDSITSGGTTGLLNVTQSQTSPTTWTVTVISGPGGQAGTITAVAECTSDKQHKPLTTAFAQGPVTTFAAGTTVSSTATCPAGAQVVTGGSFDIAITVPGVAIHITQSQTSPTTWTVTTVSPAAGGAGGTITAVAECTSAKKNQQFTTTIAKGPVSTFAAGTMVSSTATCPVGDQVVTGGSFDFAITSAGTAIALSITQSQTSPTTWTVTAGSGPGGVGGTIAAVAECSSLS